MRIDELYAQLVRSGKSTTQDEAEWESRVHRCVEPKPRRCVGTGPRKPEHIQRRRGWGDRSLPHHIARMFGLTGQAVLKAVEYEVRRNGDCRLSHKEVADLAGCSETSVRNTLRAAKGFRFIRSTERRMTRDRNATNIVEIVDPIWIKVGGVKAVTRPPVYISKRVLHGPVQKHVHVGSPPVDALQPTEAGPQSKQQHRQPALASPAGDHPDPKTRPSGRAKGLR